MALSLPWLFFVIYLGDGVRFLGDAGILYSRKGELGGGGGDGG